MLYGRADPALIRILDCRYGRMMYLVNDAYIGRALDVYGEYSESEVALWRQFVQPNWVVADVGANIGAHTVALARLVPHGHVVAFEPIPFLYYLLCGNLALNGLTSVRALNAAAGDAPGTLQVPPLDYTKPENYGGLALGEYSQGAPVDVLPLDDVLRVVHFIKADVEGMEGAVIRGAKRLIAEYKPILYVENNPSPAMPELIDQIHALGYDLWWHYAPHFNSENYGRMPIDLEPGVISFNMLGLPKNSPIPVNGLTKIPEDELDTAVHWPREP